MPRVRDLSELPQILDNFISTYPDAIVSEVVAAQREHLNDLKANVGYRTGRLRAGFTMRITLGDNLADVSVVNPVRYTSINLAHRGVNLQQLRDKVRRRLERFRAKVDDAGKAT